MEANASHKRVRDMLKNQISDKDSYPVVGALVDNQLTGLDELIRADAKVEPVTITSPEGKRIFERSLAFLLHIVVNRLIPKGALKVKYAYGEAVYCEIDGIEVDNQLLNGIKHELDTIIRQDKPIERIDLTKEEAIALLKASRRHDQIKLIKYLPFQMIPLYKCMDCYSYFYEPLVPSTGYLKVYELKRYGPGFLITPPDASNPYRLAVVGEQPKLFTAFANAKEEAEILRVETVGELNEIIASGKISDFIKVQEALHERRLIEIADMITKDRDRVKLVLVAGPSSSGKTTFSKLLYVHLMANGLKPITVSLDDYFVDRDRTPLDEEGNPDYDCIEAVDVKLFNTHLQRMLNNETVELPKFDFRIGKRRPSGRYVKLDKDTLLIIEGMHALNPIIAADVSEHTKLKIYVSALTQINMDNTTRLSTRDTRLLRRLVRDNLFRGHTALQTLRLWPSVVRGEEHYVFPFQEEADVMFNSASLYELAVLKGYAEPILRGIDSSQPEYKDAIRLLAFLSHFMGIMPDEIPPTSIIREFIGGSSFRY